MIEMRIFSIIALACIMTFVSLEAKSQNSYFIPRYNIKSYGTGTEGTYLAEMIVFLPKPNKNVNVNLCKAAVHGVLFKGLTADNKGNAQRALVSASAETQYCDFFSNFFANEYLYSRYVSVVDGSLRVEKAEKKLYRIKAIVSIQKDALRKYLEEQHIIESFKDLF